MKNIYKDFYNFVFVYFLIYFHKHISLLFSKILIFKYLSILIRLSVIILKLQIYDKFLIIEISYCSLSRANTNKVNSKQQTVKIENVYKFTCKWSKRASRPRSVTAQHRNDKECTYRCANGKPRVNSGISSSVAARRTKESKPLLTKEAYNRVREVGCIARASRHRTTGTRPVQRRGFAYRMSLHLVQTCVQWYNAIIPGE